MRLRMNALALQGQKRPWARPSCHEIFCFRGSGGDLVRLLWHDGVGMVEPLHGWMPAERNTMSKHTSVVRVIACIFKADRRGAFTRFLKDDYRVRLT